MLRFLRGHTKPLVSAIYNTTFHHVVSADLDTVIIWDVDTGRQVFSFCLRHLLGDDDDCLVSLSFDQGERRLLVGTRQGQFMLLNYINGQLLREFPRQPHEIVQALHVVNKYALPSALDACQQSR